MVTESIFFCYTRAIKTSEKSLDNATLNENEFYAIDVVYNNTIIRHGPP